MPTEIPESSRADVEAALFAGRKIEAVKLVRAATGLGLKEAKDLTDALETELRAGSPEKFKAAAKSGCAGMVLLAFGILLAIAFSVHARV